tara:strand:+ start:22676 stop:32734 length:10059 start_codon:yes stop_codon:yes gene_type:complete
MPLYNPVAPTNPPVEEPTQPQQPAPQQEVEFQPQWDAKKTRQIIQYHKKIPGQIDPELIRQHAHYHNIPFYEGEFDLLDSLQQAMGGFVEGFTTLNIVDPPDNEYEAIIRNISHLAGFAPGIMAGPAKLLGASKASLGMIQALGQKSVPMMAANFAQKKAKEIVKPVLKGAISRTGEGAGVVSNFLLGNRARHVVEGAFHLGVASSVSSWQGGIDQMLHAFIGGAQAGAVFRGIGNMMGANPSQGTKMVKAMAGSLYMGLPATQRGATTPEQIYEYLLGAYFGGKEMPWTQAHAQKFLVKMRKEAQTTPEYRVRMDPEAHPDWIKGRIPAEVKPIIKKMARETFGDPDDRAALNYHIAKMLGQEGRIDPLPIEIEGFNVTKEYDKGEVVYKLDKKSLKKWRNYGVSGGDGPVNAAWAQEGAKYHIPFIHYTTKGAIKDIPQTTPGYRRPLKSSELSEANTALNLANKTLDRSLTGMSEGTMDLLRKNHFKVKNTDSIYIVGEITKGFKELAGGSGWVAQMGIDLNKRVNAYDQMTKRWYEWSPSKDRFTEIPSPKKPTRRFAAFGQGSLTKDGKKAIEDFYKLHFKSPKKKALDAPKPNRFSQEEEARLMEIEGEYEKIEKQSKMLNDAILKGPEPGEQRRIEGKLEELEELEYRLMQEEADIRQGESQRFLDQEGKDLESEQRTEDTEIGTRDDIRIGKRSLIFVNDHMESTWGSEANTPLKSLRKAELAAELQELVKDYVDIGSTTNRSEEAAKAIKKLHGKDSLDQDGVSALRTWMTRLNQDRPVQMLGADSSGKIKLLNIDDAVTQSGNRKNLKDPEKLIETVAEAAGIPKGKVYAILDHVSMKDKQNVWKDMELVRMREWFKQKAKTEAEGISGFNRLIAQYMREMDAKGYYAYGGRGDADKIFFVAYHPKADGSYLNLARANNYFGKFYKLAEEDFLRTYHSSSSNTSKHVLKNAKEMFKKAFESNLLYDVQMNGLSAETPAIFRKSLEAINQDGFIGNSKAWNKRNQIWFTNSYKGDRSFIYDKIKDLTGHANINKRAKAFGYFLNRKAKAKERNTGKVIMRPHEIEEAWDAWTKSPEYSPTAKKDIVRKDIPDFDPVKSKIEFAAAFDYTYNEALGKFEPVYEKAGDLVPAWVDHKKKIINIDRKGIEAKFNEKAWTKPKVKGVDPLPEGQFQTAEEFERFVIEHELAHLRDRPKYNEPKGAYENRINQAALEEIANSGNYKYKIIEDLPQHIRDKYKLDKKHGQWLDTKNSELEEPMDGSILVRDDVIKAILGDAGQHLSGGQNKSFIVNPHNKRGAVLGKYMMHSAGAEETIAMQKEGIHFKIMDTAAKQRGDREYNKIYNDLDPENVRYNFSVKQDPHMMDPQRVPKQLLGAVVENTWFKTERKVIDDMFKELIQDKFHGEDKWNGKLMDYLDMVGEAGFSEARKENLLNDLIRNVDKIGIHKMMQAMKLPNNDRFVNSIWRHIMKVNTDALRDAQASGEEKKNTRAMTELAEFDTVADNIIGRMEEFVAQQKQAGINVDSTIAFNHKYVNHYRMQAIKNWVVAVATKPRVTNSAVARMRPWDQRMRDGSEDKYNKFLKELETRDDIFFLDEAYRDKMLHTGDPKLGNITLGELWDRHYKGEFDADPRMLERVEEIMRGAVVRVPMDSVSGTQILKFKGFTNRPGYGILMHGRAMRALGGADLDGDEAFVYFGGKGGFKRSWKDVFENNKKEFYKYTDGQRVINHYDYIKLDTNMQKKWRAYVGDSKDSPILKGDKAGMAYNRLLANQPNKKTKEMYDSLAWKYSPSQRLRMSQMSVDGRDMIDLAVSNKQLMNFAYNSIMANRGTPGKDEFETDFYNKKKKKWQRIKVKVYGKEHPEWQQQTREMGRAQVNLAADPMDEFGLKSGELWFKELYNSYFNIGNVLVFSGYTPEGVKKWRQSKYIKPGMLQMSHLKQGVFGKIDRMNKAFYGRNWDSDRKWHMHEITDMAGDYMDLGLEMRNSMLPKIAEMLHPIDFSDSALQRTNWEATKKLYEDVEASIGKYDWLKDNKILSRTTFRVPRNFIIDQVKKLKLHTPDGFGEATKHFDRFAEAIKGTHYRKIEDVLKLAADPRTGLAYRRKIIREMVEQANDFFVKDLTDMITIKMVNDIAKTMTEDELFTVGEIHKKVEHLKKHSYLRARELSKLNDFDPEFWLEQAKTDPKVQKMFDEFKKIGYDLDYKGSGKKSGSQGTAELNQMEIDAEIMQFKEMLTSKEKKIFDIMMLGSLNRGNLAKIDKVINKIDRWDALTKDLIFSLYQDASRTSLSQLGFNSKAVEPQNLRNYMGELAGQFEVAKKRMGKDEAKAYVDVAITDKEMSQGDWEYELQKLADAKITGFEGLKEGPVSTEMKKIASEIYGNMNFYGPKVKNSISELVRGLFSKDLNTMNLEDWRVFNDWLKTMRAGTLWQRLFDGEGKLKLHWRHWYMFPASISREIMRDDMQMLYERGFFATADGRNIEGQIARPTTYIDKVQGWIGKMNAQSEGKTDDLIRDLQTRLLFVNSFEDGEKLRQIAVGKRNALEAERIANDVSNENMSDALRYQRADEYRKKYKDLNKEFLYEESLMNKEYHLTIEGERKVYTGEEVVEMINKQYTEIFGEAHRFIKGDKEIMEPFIMGYYDPITKLSPKIDTKKFIKHLEKTWTNGVDVTENFGIDGLRMVARQLQIDMLPEKMKDDLIYKAFEETGRIPPENYWPHMMFNAKEANRALVDAARAVKNDPTLDADAKKVELTKLIHKHRNLTGDWNWADIAEWDMVDRIMEDIAGKKKTSEYILKWFNGDQRTGNLHKRSSHIGGWSIDANIPEMYLKGISSSYFKNLSQIYSRGIIHDQMYNNKAFRKKFGDKQADAWVKFMKLFANDAMGHPSVIPDSYRKDPNLKVSGTLYDWWADDKVAARLTSMKKKIFGSKADIKLPEELKGYHVDLQQVRELSNMEAQFEMAALLAHPKTVVGNLFGGNMHTIQSVGWRNFKDGISLKYLASINPDWSSKDKVQEFVTAAGVMPEQMMYEFGLTKEASVAKNKEFIEAAAKRIFRDPSMADTTITNLAKRYGVTDKIKNFAAKWMTIPERKLRRDAFMSHYVHWWKKLGGAVRDHNHPFLIEMAKRGVKATQFLYSAPYRPAFSRTALGKVMTRFMLWSWNAVRFRNDVHRQAKIYGFREGTEEFDRFVRTTQIDMFVFALGNIFAYSLFDTAMPAPYTWFEDTAQWVFGDEEERDKAFFGVWPTAVAPLQVISPPVARIPLSIISSIANNDYDRLAQYYVYTMFPFGRLGRDFSPLAKGNLIENPTRVMEKWAGMPARDLQQAVKRWKEGQKPQKPKPTGLINPFAKK